MAKKAKMEPVGPDLFCRLVKTDLGLDCVRELRFDSVRRWRFDYALPEVKIAIEVEGGVFKERSYTGKDGLIHTTIGGRHTSGVGFLKDMEKYNTATSLGWRLLRVTPDTLITTATFDLIRKTLANVNL